MEPKQESGLKFWAEEVEDQSSKLLKQLKVVGQPNREEA